MGKERIIVRRRNPNTMSSSWGDSGFVGRVAEFSREAFSEMRESGKVDERGHAAFTNLDRLMVAAEKYHPDALRSLRVAADAQNDGEELMVELRERRETLLRIASRRSLGDEQSIKFRTFLERLADHHMGNVAAEASGFTRPKTS